MNHQLFNLIHERYDTLEEFSEAEGSFMLWHLYRDMFGEDLPIFSSFFDRGELAQKNRERLGEIILQCVWDGTPCDPSNYKSEGFLSWDDFPPGAVI